MVQRPDALALVGRTPPVLVAWRLAHRHRLAFGRLPRPRLPSGHTLALARRTRRLPRSDYGPLRWRRFALGRRRLPLGRRRSLRWRRTPRRRNGRRQPPRRWRWSPPLSFDARALS